MVRAHKWEIWIFKILLTVNPIMATSFRQGQGKGRERWLHFWAS